MKKVLTLLLSSYALLGDGKRHNNNKNNNNDDETNVNEDSTLINDENGNIESDIIGSSDELYSACNNLDNGVQWIRPFDGTMENGEEWPNIKVRCQNGWTILDYDLDSYISKYFSSFTSWTEYAASSSLDDRVTWREWFLPSNEDSNMKFRLSENCLQCTESEEYSDNSAYYMTGNYIGCLWVTKGYCDMDPDTLECYTCGVGHGADGSSMEYSGLCTHMEMSADESVYTEHDMCTTNSFNAVPSLGTNGQYCMCYQPETAELYEAGSSYDRPDSDNSLIASNNNGNEENTQEQSADTLIKIYNTDLSQGTYRITAPGIYQLQEDLIVNMNAPDTYDEPNGIGAWYPNENSENIDYYEGADGSFVGAYSMGFFAGFAIESSDVTIDLNGFEMKMSKEFHLQQRWYSHIEIGSKAFISGQGPGNFGAFLTKSENIVIKNGILGLTSHHGIHGNNGNNIIINDLIIKDFEVAGIALNGFNGLLIENVEVGPCYQQVPVLGVYTQARVMLPRMRAVAESTEDTVELDYRSSDRKKRTMSQLEEELERQMDTIFSYVIEGTEYDDDDLIWSKAKSTFINDNGYPSASTVYGIFLNSQGASVFAVGGAPGYSYDATLNNIKIHDLINDPWEVPRIMNTKGPFNDIVDVTRATDNGLIDISSARYIGNAYTDAQYALNELTDSWSILSHSAWTDPVINWIKKGQALNEDRIRMKCNNDIMLHVTKGVFGLRLDSIDTFSVNNVNIENLQNIGYYGSSVCGSYMTEDDGGHRNQRSPMQSGYTGTEMHGFSIINSKGKIDNLNIGSLISARGDAYGLQIFPGNEIELGKITIRDVHGGAYSSTDDLLLYNAKPNKIPRGCAIDYWTYYDSDDDTLLENSITYTDDSEIIGSCVSGLISCDWTYSSELISNLNECSKSNGNLIDSNELIEGKIYHAIETNNGGIYSGIIATLLNQDTTRDNGATTKIIREMEQEQQQAIMQPNSEESMTLIDDLNSINSHSSNNNINNNEEASEIDGSNSLDGVENSDDASQDGVAILPVKRHAHSKTIWIYVVVICIIILICLVSVFRKCLRTRPVNRSDDSRHTTIDGRMKRTRNDSQFSNYSSTGVAEYTPLISTGPTF